MAQERRFPSPFELEHISGVERMYPYYFLFSEDRREYEEKQFWFWDAMHYPEAIHPFDLIYDLGYFAVSQCPSRVFVIPPAGGLDYRILNGYLYLSPNAITDPKLLGERAPLFEKRVGFYFEHWNELYEKWVPKMTALINELKKIEFKDLPKYEDESVVLEHTGISSGYLLLENYDRLTENMNKAWQYHFEFLVLVYLAYVMFYDFCLKAFPEIAPNTIAKMVAGAPGVMMLQPPEELAKLARSALALGVGDVLKKGLPGDDTVAELNKTIAGRVWLDAVEKTKDPWFYTSSGTGASHTHTWWFEDLSIPFGHIKGYIEKIERGEAPERPVEEIMKERERLRAEYRELLPTEEDKKTFDQSYETLAMAYPYAENHIFYVENWHHGIFYAKVRELGRVLTNARFFKEPDDIFYFFYTDIPQMLIDLVFAWSVECGTPPRGPAIWPKEVEWRKELFKKLQQWTPPTALGPPPEVVTDPFCIQLWGVTTETIESWLAPKPAPEEVTELKGFPASAGVVEGTARVVLATEELETVQAGEILVCPITAPSWAPVFGKIKAAVTDIGGMSCHAAIVAREFGLPAVVGTGFATKIIMTGDKLKVDGATGIVTIER